MKVLIGETGFSLMELDCPFPGGGDIYESRGSQGVYLHHRNNASSPTGIYLCAVTIAVSPMRHTVYLGLYTGSGTSLLLHALIDYSVYKWKYQMKGV